MRALFNHSDAWKGGYFELALELGPRSDERLRKALRKVWAHPTLSGCFQRRDAEPEVQKKVNPSLLDLQQHAHGIANIPRIGRACCVTIPIREQEGPDWLTLGVPMGSLSRVASVGAYSEDVRREGIPAKRWFGYLWREDRALQWYAPTEGAPFDFDNDGA
jgi:hypothetical protein